MKKRDKMKVYKVRLKHDKGFFTLFLAADSTDEAMKKACDLERAPLRAVRSVRLARKGEWNE
jgi:hypothetical protein